MRYVLFAVCCVLCAGGCEPAQLGEEWRRIESPVEAPNFTLPQLSGPSVSLSNFRGRVVIMEFWATWCGPCRMSTPSLEAIYREHKQQPVTVLLVNAGESAEEVRRWAGRRFTAPILLDAEGTVRQLYGVEGIPRLLIIDQAGRIVYDHSGYGGSLEQSLRVILKGLLASADTLRLSALPAATPPTAWCPPWSREPSAHV